MDDAPATDPTSVDAIAHAALQAGRIMLLNGAETDAVEAAVIRFATAFGCEAHLMVSYEALLLTIVHDGRFRTKIGSRVPAMNVGMSAISAVTAIINDAETGRIGLQAAIAALDAVERQPPEYNRWLVVLLLGLTAASLSRLFGGDWPTFAIVLVAGAAGTWLRQALGRRHANPIAIPFAAACFSGCIGGLAVRFGWSATPALCLVAPGMIIVPGVPLINGVQDLIRNHITLGISRLGFGSLVTTAIALGLFAATLMTGAVIPVEGSTQNINVAEDAVFSALAALGYAALFNVPARMAWVCVLCGICSHTLRTICGDLGIDIVGGTLLGALVSGTVAELFGRRFHAPAAAFAFAGVVAMVPGAYAFRMVLGGLQIADGSTDLQLITTTLSLAVEVVLMVAAIAVGVAAPALLFRHPPVRHALPPTGSPGNA